MRFFVYAPLIGAAIASPTPLSQRFPTRSFPDDTLERRAHVNTARANAVKQMFQIGYSGYQKYAFPMDQLEPVTNQGFNPR